MKAFNLRLAKQGHPVCTRDGHEVRIVCWDYNSVVNDNRPIIALISEGENEVAVVRGLDGKVSQNEESNLDLMMVMNDWELGYKYAFEKALEWIEKFAHNSVITDNIGEREKQAIIISFKEYLEEQQ